MTKKQKIELERVLRLIPGYDPWAQAEGAWLDHEAARHGIDFFAECLKHPKGKFYGQPFELEPWQKAIPGNVFGWKRKNDHGEVIRRYRRCLLYIARGNGKTPLSAGLALYGLSSFHFPGAEIYLAAGKREQAGFLYANAIGMRDQEPELVDRTTVYEGENNRRIIWEGPRPHSFIAVIPAEASGIHGSIPAMALVDELHVQKSGDFLRALETGMAKETIAEPLLIMITTADYAGKTSICNEVYDHACKVRDNGGDRQKPGYDPTFLPVIYEATEDDDWNDERVWAKANPNLGVSVTLSSLRELHAKAQEQPTYENEFRRLHLNQRVSQDVRVIKMDRWDACRREYTAESLRGRVCYVGVDLASREDLAAVTAVFPWEDDGVRVLSWAFCPEDKVEIRARRKVPYDVWARAGYLIPTPGGSIDYRKIRALLKELDQMYLVQMIACDPKDARETMTILAEEDGFAERVCEVPQSMAHMSAPTKELISLVKTERFYHDGNPVLRWAASNLAVKYDGVIPDGADVGEYLDKVPVFPSKRQSADKIDPIVAAILGLAAKQRSPIVESGSVYSSRGIECL